MQLERKKINILFPGKGWKRPLPAIVFALLLSGGAYSGYAVAFNAAAPQSVEASDEVSMQKAGALYKQVKELQFQGAEEEEVYNAVLDANAMACKILDSDTISDNTLNQCKGIILDLNNLLAKGAVHYSVQGNSAKMVDFARAFVDAQLQPKLADAPFNKDKELYPALVYSAASGCYNKGDHTGAIKYFEEYLNTGEKKQRQPVALFYGQALLSTNQAAKGAEKMAALSEEFPSDFNMLTIALQLCIDAGRRDLMPKLLTRALEVKPDDERLLNLQASLLEEQRDYRGALDIYMQLEEKHPNSLSVNECVARCYYNLGTNYYNKSISELDEKEASKQRRQSNAYFSSAAEKYEDLSANDPNNPKYLKAMATSYACLGNKSKVESINTRLAALGQPTTSMTGMPVLMGAAGQDSPAASRSIPSYQEYAQAYVTDHLKTWMKRGEFEKLEDYEKRVSPESLLKERERLSSIIADRYLTTYANQLAISELKLEPYDVDNETYAITSEFGPIYLKVPVKNQEAEIFKNNWDQIQIRNPKFFVKNDKIAISSISFISPTGKEYAYNASNKVDYEGDKIVNVDVQALMADMGPKTPAAKESGKKTVTITKKSDVDQNIPQNPTTNSNTVALIIANENYNKVINVAAANHDGEVFAQYCRETLGIPADQVLLFEDATYGETLSAINKLRNYVKAIGGDVDVIVYYAGHGVPDEKTSDAYMMPIDADPLVMATAYPLKTLYKELGEMGANNVMVFMDACFSGANRGDGMLTEARGVVLVPKKAAPEGNMFVLSAASGNETALPYKEKNHGLFTYYLLKKLQDSKGNVSLKELSDYVSQEVPKVALKELNKSQTPTVTSSGVLSLQLDKTKLRK
ncbi:MAG: caspase family protein [Muribaculaceae bacterium]|nr:caspase family protein [Muribaculaceae bacterium]